MPISPRSIIRLVPPEEKKGRLMPVGRSGCDGDAPPQQQHEQPHHCTGPDEAQLLADDGKDEVVLRFGHEKVLLAAVAQPQPGCPA